MALRQLLARAGGAIHSQQFRRFLHISLVLLGLVVQGVLLLTVAYLCDLAISLMELWAELARQHLRITL